MEPQNTFGMQEAPPKRKPIRIRNHVDAEGNPMGGEADGQGFSIHWQDGPEGPGNWRGLGAQVDEVLMACRVRLRFLQNAAGGKYACLENEAGIDSIQRAINGQEARTEERRARGVEGTMEP